MNHIVQLCRVDKVYRQGSQRVQALDSVSLDICDGDFVAVVGPSGSGKSTLLSIAGCLDLPTGGTVIVGGRDVTSLTDQALSSLRNRFIGFVFQSFNLIGSLSALDNVGLPLYYAGISTKERRDRAQEVLRSVGLGHRANHRPAELSGGEEQRVAIARAIVTEPALLVADEPTGNLDTATQEGIMDIFHQLNASGTTIMLVTHDPQVAEHAGRIHEMVDGRIEPSVGA